MNQEKETNVYSSQKQTDENNKRLARKAEETWRALTKEQVTCEVIGGTLYAFGSELACLRLAYVFRGVKSARCDYSENLGTWFFSKDK